MRIINRIRCCERTRSPMFLFDVVFCFFIFIFSFSVPFFFYQLAPPCLIGRNKERERERIKTKREGE